eukprot:TRINITY_DN5926_c0_g1_i1.p1 TRINITY_DN5926_c0_g1~~TRINITY_DN5926_c0_g1_i1.p1  ORF type:complete len:668 (-),score=113.85 TRINITY_DN5926_c0_g1_i1:87-2090(-)
MDRNFNILCTIVCIALFSFCSASKSRVTVSIPTVGKVQGFKASDYSNVIGFTGIRYAEAPVGDLRWAAPKSTSWDNFVATERIICPQPDTFITPPNITKSEDCLRINIWVREDVLERTKAGQAPQNGAPVLVVFHGGAFIFGSGLDKFFEPDTYADDYGFVFVTINYRLGALGFLAHPWLSESNPSAPTNFGLLDQRFALQWIQKNIKYFGGNPAQVTLVGESAGAVSVLAHLRSQKSFGDRSLFKRAILLSPVVLMPTLTLEESEQAGRQRAARLGCAARDNLAAEIACMRLVSASEFEDPIERNVFFHAVRRAEMGPVSDGVNFEATPHALIEGTGYFGEVDVMMGTVLDEGSLFTYSAFPMRAISESFFQKLIENAFGPFGRPGLVDGILRLYSVDLYRNGGRNYTEPTMQALADVVGDFSFTCQVRQLLSTVANHRQQVVSSKSKVFGFVWAVPAYADPWLKVLGTAHGSELDFFFGKSNTDRPESYFLRSFSQEELELGGMFRESIASFVKTGDPSTEFMKWQPFNAEEKKLMIMESASSIHHQTFKNEKCDFFDIKFPEGGVPPIMVAEPLAGEDLMTTLMNDHVVKASIFVFNHKTESWIAVSGILVGIFAWFLRYFFRRMYAVAMEQKAREEADKKKQKILGPSQKPTAASQSAKKKRE